MPHFDTSTMQWLTIDWFPVWTNQKVGRLLPGELPMAMAYIDGFFAAHAADPKLPIGVAMNCPGIWPPELEPLYIACSGLEDDAAKLAGNLYCRVAIRRPEAWWSFPDTKLQHKPRKYLLDSDLHNAAYGI